jgi:hypothetical protein
LAELINPEPSRLRDRVVAMAVRAGLCELSPVGL